VDLLGIGKLTSAFGLVISFQGVTYTVVPPIAGKFYRYQSFKTFTHQRQKTLYLGPVTEMQYSGHPKLS
jgi:hypothetical protein